jgi:hypothetical protein
MGSMNNTSPRALFCFSKKNKDNENQKKREKEEKQDKLRKNMIF